MIDHLAIDYEKQYSASSEESPMLTDQQNKNDNVRTLSQPYVPLQGKSLSLTYLKLENRRKSISLEQRLDYYIKRNKIDKEFVEEKIAFSQSLSTNNENK